jgi:hypothetical protein
MQPFDEAVPSRRAVDPSVDGSQVRDSLADGPAEGECQVPLGFGFGSGQVEPLFWHRLVDEELSEDQYRQMFVKLETRPELWRDCALAFLEDQALKKALRGLGGAPVRGPALATPSVEVFANTDQPPADPLSADQTLAGSGGPAVAAAWLTADAGWLTADAGGVEMAGRTCEPLRRGPASSGQVVGDRGPFRRLMSVQASIPWVTAAAGFLLAFAMFGLRSLETPAGSRELSEGIQAPLSSEPSSAEADLYGNLLANLSPSDLEQLFAKASQRRVRSTVQATPAVLVPGELKADRRFLFYRDQNGNTLVLPVDDYQYVAQDFQ